MVCKLYHHITVMNSKNITHQCINIEYEVDKIEGKDAMKIVYFSDETH